LPLNHDSTNFLKKSIPITLWFRIGPRSGGGSPFSGEPDEAAAVTGPGQD